MNPGLIISSNSDAEDKQHGTESLYKSAVPNALILRHTNAARLP